MSITAAFIDSHHKMQKPINRTPKRLADYRLCVYASGSVIIDVFNLSFTFRRFYRNYILPSYIDDYFPFALGAEQGEVFKHRIGAHFNPGLIVADRA